MAASVAVDPSRRILSTICVTWTDHHWKEAAFPWRTEFAMIDSQGVLGSKCPMKVQDRHSDSVTRSMVGQCSERIARSAATVPPPTLGVLGVECSNEFFV